jgi:hypothetical protein
VTAGYAAAANAELGATNATLCPEDTYRSTELPYDPANGVTCIACPPGMVTGPGNEGATSLEACLAPPGYGYDPFAGNATICPLGWFKEGYNRQPCTLCGLGTITTDAPGATMADECLIPAGHFTTRSADGETLTGAPCPVGTYGRLNSTYGLVDVECVKCDEHTITLGIGSNAVLQCVTEPGYGWYNGQVEECAYGYYSPGNNQNPCVWCGSGFNTTAGGATTVAAITGATASTDCVVAAGWTGDGVSGIKPCTRGWYKSLLGDSPCLRCPRGTTTSISDGAVALSDCDSCLAGFYNAALNVSDPGCTICTSGTYSFGNRPGGNGCLDCPKPLHYTGKMASRRVRASGPGLTWGPPRGRAASLSPPFGWGACSWRMPQAPVLAALSLTLAEALPPCLAQPQPKPPLPPLRGALAPRPGPRAHRAHRLPPSGHPHARVLRRRVQRRRLRKLP